jgi:ABC-2 type transport system ATP-binding protein
LHAAAVIDGVIQGRAVRLVLRSGAPPPDLSALEAGADAQMVPVKPRFEDAFIDLLGGGPGGESALARVMPQVAPNRHDNAVIEARNLTKRFGDFVATDDISFAVQRGEIFGLLGPNGAGKSTTFKMLCGLLAPSAGRAAVLGIDLKTSASRARQQLGYMAQKFSLYGNLTVGQNLDFFSGVYGLTGRTQATRISEMVEAFDLARFLRETSETLPLGFKQRLALACAIMHEPPVLFLDEPTSGVDPITRREFWTHINGLVEKGVTVMVTTHFMDEAEYCDRIALVYRGQLIAAGTPDALKELVADHESAEPTMEDAFVELVHRHDRELAHA